MHFLDILVVLRLDLGQISFNLGENAFATRQLALLATRIAFYDILARACAEIKILNFLNFFPFPFSSFLEFLFAAVIDLLLGKLVVKKLLRKSHRGARRPIFTMEQPGVVAGNFALT